MDWTMYALELADGTTDHVVARSEEEATAALARIQPGAQVQRVVALRPAELAEVNGTLDDHFAATRDELKAKGAWTAATRDELIAQRQALKDEFRLVAIARKDAQDKAAADAAEDGEG